MVTFNVVQEGPVNALALNRDNTQVAISGRNVFKVYLIEEDKFKEVCNLRTSKHLNLSFSCNDISWSVTDDHYLATAATNGHVCVWNLTKMGKAMQEQDYQEHKRTVNKVNFHSSEPNRLISGSQDGTMKYFDIRLKTSVATFHSNTESVRDVQFSPHIPQMFAAVSENGSVQLWDIRRPDKCQQQFTAHSGPVFACDWHPEVPWIATASRDKTIKVWDLSSKPTLEYTIHTIASVGHVKWRPQRKYHIASCALVVDCSINIWDIRRPYIPFAAFNEHKDVSTCVAWRGEPHVFLSTSRDCTLYQHAFKDASRPASKANPQGISLNTKGDILYACQTPTNPNFLSKVTNLVRKNSNTLSSDQFHQASSQLSQFMCVLSQDMKCFCNLAKNYLITGQSFSELCEHNANVAKQFGKHQVSLVWQILRILCSEEFRQNSSYPYNSKYCDDNLSFTNIVALTLGSADQSTDNEQKSRGGDTPAAQNSGGDDETEAEDQVDHVSGFTSYNNFKLGLPRGDFTFGENELDLELDGLNSVADIRNGFHNYHISEQIQDWTLPNEAFNIRHEIQDRSPPPEQFPKHNSPDINDDGQIISTDDHFSGPLTVFNPPKRATWDPSTVIVDALKYHANLGDIQTAACVLLVLGDQRQFLNGLDEATQEHWLLGYIDLLGRYRLWDIAAQVIKLSWIPSINQMSQQSTRINTNCGKCSKPLQRAGWLCDRCHSSEYSLCSVCHQVVRGLYAWCQGCSHGGHLAHIQKWIRSNNKCPTGCGHLCEYG
ncbi:GATOR complex protein WDR24 [Agrilus planipennis]|uniref:GATOR2 complex protein WDR24 n=1 Tax=Agrilus planipennis TaxID=224129 RepID=A0A1W4XHW8_AGRPL|nr:GATOR complex protein WDR24 [Agrilus planipennis]